MGAAPSRLPAAMGGYRRAAPTQDRVSFALVTYLDKQVKVTRTAARNPKPKFARVVDLESESVERSGFWQSRVYRTVGFALLCDSLSFARPNERKQRKRRPGYAPAIAGPLRCSPRRDAAELGRLRRPQTGCRMKRPFGAVLLVAPHGTQYRQPNRTPRACLYSPPWAQRRAAEAERG